MQSLHNLFITVATATALFICTLVGAITGIIHWVTAGILLTVVISLALLNSGVSFKTLITEVKRNAMISTVLIALCFLMAYCTSSFGEDIRTNVVEYNAFKHKCTELKGEVLIDRTGRVSCVIKIKVGE